MVDDLDKKLRALGRATDGIRPSDAISDAVVDGLQQENPFASLAAATDGLAPSDDFSDAVMARVMKADVELPSANEGATSDDGDDDPLLRAQRATASLRPTDDFTDAVLAAVADEPAHSRVPASQLMSGFAENVGRSARSGLFVAAVAAAACVLLSWYTQRDFDSQLLLQAEIAEEAE